MEHYRKRLLHGEVAIRLRILIRDTFKAMDVEIITGHVSEDRLHLFVSVLTFVSVSNRVQRLQGRSSRRLLSEYRTLARQFWSRNLWIRKHFAASSGNVTAEVIAQYVEM